MDRSGAIIKWIWTTVLMVVVTSIGYSHEVRPAYLEIKEVGDYNYRVIWKVPLLNQRVPDIQPIIGDGHNLTSYNQKREMEALMDYKDLVLSEDIGGLSLRVTNLEKTLIDVIVRLERANGEIHTFLIQPSDPEVIIPTSSSPWQVAKTFGILGVEHILLGWDHLLFVFGLMLLIRKRRLLITTITAFTIAHSITLIFASLGILRLPSAPVETVIALSIVFLGREYILMQRGERSMTAERPWLVAFIFGLLHGCGFAGALASIGLPNHAVLTSLLSFNVGVEIGQLIFVASLLLLYFLVIRLMKIKMPRWAVEIPGYAIGGMASFWFITRLLDIVAF